MMEYHPLLDVLANWPGRVSTQLAFEARGFLVGMAKSNDRVLRRTPSGLAQSILG
jgi:hypothetical protein